MPSAMIKQHQRQGSPETPLQLSDLLLDEHRDHDVTLPAEERRRDVETEREDKDQQAPGGHPRQAERQKDARGIRLAGAAPRFSAARSRLRSMPRITA